MSQQYTCFVPRDPPNGVNDARVIVKSKIIYYSHSKCLFLQVTVGQNVRYEIGTVTYKRNEGEPSPTEEGASSTSPNEEGTSPNEEGASNTSPNEEGASNTSPNEEGASTTGAIVGSVISVLVVLSGAIILILVLFVVFKRKTSANETLLANRFAHHEMVETKGGILYVDKICP